MKVAEIQTGQDYLYSTSREWETKGYGISRIRVIDTRPWTMRTLGWNEKGEPVETTVEDGSVHLIRSNWYTVESFKAPTFGDRPGILVEHVRLDGSSYTDEELKRSYSARYDIVQPQHIRGLFDAAAKTVRDNKLKEEEARKRRDAAYDAKRERFTSSMNDLLRLVPELGVYVPSFATKVEFEVEDLETIVARLKELSDEADELAAQVLANDMFGGDQS